MIQLDAPVRSRASTYGRMNGRPTRSLPLFASALVILVTTVTTPSFASPEGGRFSQDRLLAIRWGEGPEAWDDVIAIDTFTYAESDLHSYYVDSGRSTGLAVDELTDYIYVKYHADSTGTDSQLVTLDPDGTVNHAEPFDLCKLLVFDSNQDRLLAIRWGEGPDTWDELIAIDPETYAITLLSSHQVNGGSTTGLTVDKTTGRIYIKYDCDDGGAECSKLLTLNPDGTVFDIVDLDPCKLLIYDTVLNRLLAIQSEEGPYASNHVIAIDPTTYVTTILYSYYVADGETTGLALDDVTGHIYLKYHYGYAGDAYSKLVKLNLDGSLDDIADVDRCKMLVFNSRPSVWWYCEAWGCCDSYISRVEIGDVDNSSSCADGYADYTNLSTEVEIGHEHGITVTNGNSEANDPCHIWADWNQDGDFYDAGEEISPVNGSGGPGPYTATIVPPQNARLGETRMRIRIRGCDPCGESDCGEVEDYMLVVTGGCIVWNVTQGTMHPSIQIAIDNSIYGDELVATPCIYHETVNFLGKAITLRSSSGASATTIDATGLNDSAVKCVSGEGPETALEGFTITGGGGTDIYGFRYGGGMYSEDSSPTVADCTFRSNAAQPAPYGKGYGGGMCNANSSPTVRDCTFSDNAAFNGGAMCNERDSSPSVIGCLFVGNTASQDSLSGPGGGILNQFNSNPTVSDCTFIMNVAVMGGGIYNSEYCEPIVTDCDYLDNVAELWGGGMCDGGDAMVFDCVFTGNVAYSGAGMASSGTSTVVDCVFAWNAAAMYGAGMYNSASNSLLVNCVFAGNTAFDGGGMMNNDSTATIANCVFVGNWAHGPQGWGGGMYNHHSDSPVISCVFAWNVAWSGGGMYNFHSSPAIVNCLFWINLPDQVDGYPRGPLQTNGSGATFRYCDIEGCGGSGDDWDSSLGIDGGGNIDAHPLFMRNPDPGPDGEWGTDDDDYGDLHLQADSACLDAGDNTAVPEGVVTDPDGNPRFVDDLCSPDSGNPNGENPIVDIGAYEYQAGANGCCEDLDGSGDVNVADLLALLGAWGDCPEPPPGCPADIDDNDTVDTADLLALLGAWGECP